MFNLRFLSSGSYSFLGDTSKTYFVDTTVTSGTIYYYVVTVVNSVGESSYSNEESATFSGPSDTTTAAGEPGAPSITSSPSFLYR